MSINWTLALRNIMRNKRRTLLTLLLISATLSVLIFTDGFMRGMTDVMIRSATRLYPGDGQIHHSEYLADRDGAKFIVNISETVESIKKQPLIESYTLRANDFGMVSSTANNLPVQVAGIDAELEATVSKLKLSMIRGNYLDNNGVNSQILIGEPLAELLEVGLGDRLVVSVNNYQTESIEQRLFRVSGVFKMNSKFFDEGLVFIQLPLAQEMMGIGSGVHEIAFNFYDESQSSNTELELWSDLSSSSIKAQGWVQLMPDLAAIIGMMDYSMFVIGSILFMVAILGVVNAMFMSIYERTYEFGVILAIGTRRSQVFRLILIEGLVLSLVSIVVGSLLGAILNFTVGRIGIDYSSMDISGVALAEVIRTDLNWNQFTVLPMSVLAMVIIASLYPAIHAARIIPAKALHKSL
ncbi:FtsX-like permease family protein [Reinekea marina]|uniref:ABC transporter permease n=1 Tax=Reinekea marina TaxID=1310421 RepID=A0ABV7WVI8_9GAMM|nr:FtsX-like permease family protein [Reinekea marina]MDN3648890.1 FtsX-like permease family protein [Reinekea marina]